MKHWQEFIDSQPKQLLEQNFICDVDEVGLILVTGEDATEFMQNQLSNDINLIDEAHFQLSSYSTPKGRMLAIFRVLRIANGYILLTTKSLVLPLLQRLQKYIVQSQVTLADASGHFARFAIQTDTAAVIEHPLLAQEVGASFQNDSVFSLQLEPQAGQRRYLVLCLSADEARSLWSEFSAALQVAGYASWKLAEIKAGMPVIHPQTSEEFVLQMSNLNLLGGVSFKKGCFPGQEIVARMQYLGTLKRRMFLASLETLQLPAPGDEIVTRGKDIVDGSGKIVDAEFAGDGLCYCLYIARIEKAESGKLCLLTQPDTTFKNIDLPYSDEDEAAIGQ